MFLIYASSWEYLINSKNSCPIYPLIQSLYVVFHQHELNLASTTRLSFTKVKQTLHILPNFITLRPKLKTKVTADSSFYSVGAVVNKKQPAKMNSISIRPSIPCINGNTSRAGIHFSLYQTSRLFNRNYLYP